MQFGVHVSDATPFASVIAKGDESVHDAPDESAETAAITRLARHSPRSQTVSFIMTMALLVTVAMSAFSAASLRDVSARFREVALYGRISAIER